MQLLTWYAQRLRAMSRQEICWRLACKIREATDRCLLKVRQRPIHIECIAVGNGEALEVRSEVVGLHLASRPVVPGDGAEEQSWIGLAVARADAICRNRLDLFDLEGQDVGSVIDWNYEYKAGRKAPTGFAPAIDYRDYAVTGDCKFVWEPNRHQHLVVLGRAFRLTGDCRYAETAVRHLESWIEQCPYGMGMNWRSPLELGIRIINWTWLFELIRPSGLLDRQRMARFLPVAYRHLWQITRQYSRFSSANNHLIGEAAGVYIASSYFRSLRAARRWQQESREILCREISSQTHGDGGTREQALGYHLFVAEFFLLCHLVGRNIGEEFPKPYQQQLERMVEFLAAFVEGGGSPPMFGDSDDGYVLDVGGREDRARSLLAVAAVLFGRSDFKALSGGCHEPLFWLLGRDGCKAHVRMAAETHPQRLSSRSLPDSGYYLLQAGSPGGKDAISVTFDCGELGFGPIAAHGHADALSFTLRAFGEDILVDPGTYDYFTYPNGRSYFRSTHAHNTVVVDDGNQSEMIGAFLWGRRATSRCLRWEPGPEGGTVTGEHDGYQARSGGVIHRRTISLDGRRGEVGIVDELSGPGLHTAALCLHLAESCTLERVSGQRYLFAAGAGPVQIDLDEQLRVEALRGSDGPIAGWVSRGYHRKTPTYTLVGRCTWQGRLTLRMRITLGDGREVPASRARLVEDRVVR